MILMTCCNTRYATVKLSIGHRCSKPATPTEIALTESMTNEQRYEAALYNQVLKAQRRYVWAVSFGSTEAQERAIDTYKTLVGRLGFDPFM